MALTAEEMFPEIVSPFTVDLPWVYSEMIHYTQMVFHYIREEYREYAGTYGTMGIATYVNEGSQADPELTSKVGLVVNLETDPTQFTNMVTQFFVATAKTIAHTRLCSQAGITADCYIRPFSKRVMNYLEGDPGGPPPLLGHYGSIYICRYEDFDTCDVSALPFWE